MNINIRQVRIEDLDGITQVEALCFPQAEAATRDSLLQRIGSFPQSFFVAEVDGVIIGFINGCVTDQSTITDEMFEQASIHNPNGAYQSIFGLDVTPNHQHKGIASMLMDHLIQVSKAQGRTGMILTCKQSLLGFYESFGYENKGISNSTHGGAVWYDMIMKF